MGREIFTPSSASDLKIVLSVLAVSLLAVALALLLPGGRPPDRVPKLPWKISVNADGYSSVFGVTLGKTSLAEAQQILGAKAKINLFVSPNGQYSVEGYFERLYLSGIKADLVVTVEILQPEAAAMFQRGLRVSQLGSGARKVKLTADDQFALLKTPISHITYLPATDLDAELIANLFGEPARKQPEETGVIHWLYPDKGLDIALNPNGKEVFQYVPPSQFEQLLVPFDQPGG